MAPKGGENGQPLPVTDVKVWEDVKLFFVSEFSVTRDVRDGTDGSYVIYEVTQNYIFFTSFTSNYFFFTLLTLPLWLSTPPYPHLPLFYPPSRLDGYSTGTRRVILTPTLITLHVVLPVV